MDALFVYLTHYGGFMGKRKDFNQLVRDAGIRLRKRKDKPRAWHKLEQYNVRKVLVLHYQRLGAKAIRIESERFKKARMRKARKPR